MAIELRQQLKLAQQLVMTPQLQMAIKLLQLSRLELQDTIQQELMENPALEEVMDLTPDEMPEEAPASASPEADASKEITMEETMRDDFDWQNYFDDYNSAGAARFELETRDAPQYETFIAEKESLQSHLLWQLLMTLPSKEEEDIGSAIIGNLTPDGYLEVSVEEIAEAAGAAPEQVENVLDRKSVV